ncbi:endonuclease/exonuclease/phosphatase family protein, partial [Pseudomonas nitroreducens]
WPLLRLDRIYVRHLRVTLSEVLNRKPWPHLSDHLPLLAEVSL